MIPSSHLILCHPLLLLPTIPPSIRVFSNESTIRMRWVKYWSFSFSIIPSKEIPGLIAFRMDWLDLLAVQGTLRIKSVSLKYETFKLYSLEQALANFLYKDQVGNTLGSGATTHPCSCSAKSPVDNMNGQRLCSNKVLFTKIGNRQNLVSGPQLPTPALEKYHVQQARLSV